MTHVMGIGGFLGHDANVALISGGVLRYAAQQERFSRIKHDASFPHSAIEDCLQFSGLRGEDISDVAFAEKPLQAVQFRNRDAPVDTIRAFVRRLLPGRQAGLYTKLARQVFPNARFHYVWHHVSHAAGAFVSSPFDEAAFLCLDGVGEGYSATIGLVSASNTKITHELPWGNGLGLLYTLVTHYLGFNSFGSEYKVMGLAPYGRPSFVGHLLELCFTDDDGALRLKHSVTFAPASMRANVGLIETVTGIAARTGSVPLSQGHVDIRICASLRICIAA